MNLSDTFFHLWLIGTGIIIAVLMYRGSPSRTRGIYPVKIAALLLFWPFAPIKVDDCFLR
jgi:hypothetical protein